MAKSADGVELEAGDTVYVELYCSKTDGPLAALLDDRCRAITPGGLLAPRFFASRNKAAAAMLEDAAEHFCRVQRESFELDRQYASLYRLSKLG